MGRSFSMSLTKTARNGIIIAGTTSVVILFVATLIFFNRQIVSDTIISLFYNPTPAIAELTDRVSFTPEGKRIFYATQPELSPAGDFNQDCPRQEPMSPIIGCYTSDDRVYIFDITNRDLDGIEEVTTAHEMLHAAWMRLSNAEREDLGKELDAFYETMTDAALEERIAYYHRAQPGEIQNELHSILGTEVRELTPKLEAHYARYFEDRGKVVDYHDQYNELYQGLLTQTNALHAQMETLAEKIIVSRNAQETNVEVLSRDIDSFNDRASSGEFDSMSAFYTERAMLVRRTDALEQERLRINKDIETYRQLQDSYATLASKIEILNKSLDSFQVLDSVPGI